MMCNLTVLLNVSWFTSTNFKSLINTPNHSSFYPFTQQLKNLKAVEYEGDSNINHNQSTLDSF